MKRQERTIAIGDIHGCFDKLQSLLKEIKYKPKKDKIIFLGDYIDRGDKSADVLNYVISLKKKYKNNVVLLIGNHEQMANDYLKGAGRDWLYNGYSATLKSYGEVYKDNSLAVKKFTTDLQFVMEQGVYYYEDDKNIFVHAGINPSIPLSEQDKFYMVWARAEYLYDTRKFNKTVVSGHTPTFSVNENSYAPCKTVAGNYLIDTGAVFGGRLSAYVRLGDKIEIIQTQEG